jgi:plastocyanin
MKLFACLIVSLLANLMGIAASEIQGNITIDSRISRKSVPPAVYDLRGMTPREIGHKTKEFSKFGHIAVWLETGSGSAPPIKSTMRQAGLRFDPDFLILPTGSTVLFPNFDPLFHNIFSLSPAQRFDLGYYENGKTRQVVFPRSGVVQIYCHVHPEMYGVVVTTPSQWTAIPTGDGTFTFAGVASGKYKVVVWQRTAGLVRQTISVPSNGTVQVNFTLPTDSQDQ